MTKIEWTDKTINPVVGCTHWKKPLCGNFCYAKRQSPRIAAMRAGNELKRAGVSLQGMSLKERMQLYRETMAWCEKCYKFIPHEHLDRLKEINARQLPKKIFINSLWDWNCPANKREWLEAILEKMKECSQHTFQILSKRPEGYANWNFPKNVWLGTSVTTGDNMHRVYTLRDSAFTNIRFVSFEPLHGPIITELLFEDMQWIIVGAETGNRKDKVVPDPSWIKDLHKKADAEGIPIFVKDNCPWSKGWGERPREFPDPIKIN